MIVQTRYRDLSIEEVRKCAPDFPEQEWSKLRGKPVLVGKFCDCHGRSLHDCGQPKFHRADNERWLCSCFAEIGD